MRLTHIKLAGFKSFVEKTIIPISGNLVGVVGPNGCGKSNVIDAVRWVLGESKASALRGGSMQDVIFSGSANRKPIGRASVELIFDNKLGKAAGQWSSYAEISIKRVVQRDGDSAYTVNNIRVRRRDVTDIFLGTGVGGKGYAIIEQGMISRIIEAKPQELMVFLEEAAGVSKYRVRRHETELRLADTEKNLLRIEDIHQELNKQLKHLEAQAEVAQQFNTTQEKLRHTQSLLWLAYKNEAEAQHTNAKEEIQRLELELETETNALQETTTKLEENRKQHYAASEQQHQVQGKLYSANAELARLEQQQQHLRESAERLTQQITVVEKQQEQNNEQKNDSVNDLDHWHSEAEIAHLEHAASQQKNNLENKKLPLIEADFRTCQEKLTSCQQKLFTIEQTIQLNNNHYANANKTLQNLESRHLRLLQEQATLPQPDYSALTDLQQQTECLETSLSQKKSILTQTNDQLPAATLAKNQATQDVQALQQTLTQTQARFNILQRLQQQIDCDQSLSSWLSKHKFNELPRLWQDIQIKGGWENALEAVLREQLNATAFNQLEIIQDWNDDLPPGKWTLFESPKNTEQTVNKIINNHDNWKPIQQYLSYRNLAVKPVLEEWLDNVYVVENLQLGLAQRELLSPGERLVTRAGHIFSRHSLTFYSPDSELHGVLARQQELIEIAAEIKELEQTVADESSELAVTEQVCHEMEEAIAILRHESEQLQIQHHESQLQTIKLSELAERTNHRRQQIDNELTEIKQQQLSENEHKQSAQIQLDANSVQLDELKSQQQKVQSAQDVADQLLTSQRQLVQNTQKQAQQAEFHETTCRNKIYEIEQIISALDNNADQLNKNLDHLLAENSTIDETILNDQRQECLNQRTKLEQLVIDARDTLDNASNKLQQIEQTRMAYEQKLPPLRESINKACLKEQEARIRKNQFVEQLTAVAADEKELSTILGKKQPAELQREIKQLKSQLSSLGAVNLAALDELKEQRSRENYLNTQLNDLREAVITLENVIRRIDDETRERLQKTFDTVNDHLNDIFPAIFGGGQAKLVLNSDEILDAGAQLTAQPPGKRNNSIHLLSGGEKALTALALVFSLFRLNPAPFCLLDEVDAPLDDSNTGRFCELVKKMSNQTQFLFISHNKITMEMAQQLIGVTMQEQGVSRVVAVDIEAAIKINETANIT